MELNQMFAKIDELIDYVEPEEVDLEMKSDYSETILAELKVYINFLSPELFAQERSSDYIDGFSEAIAIISSRLKLLEEYTI